MSRFISASLLCLLLLLLTVCHHSTASSSTSSTHTNNWAVIVSTSRYWFNYRHTSNALAVYHAVKKLGIPDENIILMLPEEMACDPRNPFVSTVFDEVYRNENLYSEDVEVDYRGLEVNVENFLRLITARHVSNSLPRSKRLLTDSDSNVLIYMSGHGGDGFLKFQDNEEVPSRDLADAFEQMYQQGRFKQLFFMVDTCQAATLGEAFYTKNVLAMGSSLRGQNSYSHHMDHDIGVTIVDRFTYYLLDFFQRHEKVINHKTIADFNNHFDPRLLLSDHHLRFDLFPRPINQVKIADFFSGTNDIVPIKLATDITPKDRKNIYKKKQEKQDQQKADNLQNEKRDIQASTEKTKKSLPTFRQVQSSSKSPIKTTYETPCQSCTFCTYTILVLAVLYLIEVILKSVTKSSTSKVEIEKKHQ